MTDLNYMTGSSALAASRAWRSFSRALFLLLLSGLLLTGAFPKISLWFLAPLGLVPWVVCIIRRPMNVRWFLLYYLFGALWWNLNCFWLWGITLSGTIALCCYMGVYWAIFSLVTHRLIVHLRVPAMVVVPCAWVTCEYLRSTVMTGFPWFILGNAWGPQLVLIQMADLFGVWGVSFVVALTAGWVVDVLRLPLFEPVVAGDGVREAAGGRRHVNRHIVRLSVAFGGVVVLVLSYGVFRLGQHTTSDGPRVTVVQENIPQSIKSDDSSVGAQQEITEKHLRLSQAALADKPDLIVWPETMARGYLNRDWLAINPRELSPWGFKMLTLSLHINAELEEFANKSHVFLLVGAEGLTFDPLIRQNLAILYSPSAGQMYPYYAKRHLVPFGEYIPFKSGWPALNKWLLSLTPSPDADYSTTPGSAWTRFTMRTGGGGGESREYHFGVPICYEDVMPYPSRELVRPENGRKQVEFLATISNDGWYESLNELDSHLQMDQLRAVENRVPIARSVNTGNSGFVDSNGRIMQRVNVGGQPYFVVGYATQVMPVDSRVSLYSRIGDLFPVVTGIVTGLAFALTVLRPRRGRTDLKE